MVPLCRTASARLDPHGRGQPGRLPHTRGHGQQPQLQRPQLSQAAQEPGQAGVRQDSLHDALQGACLSTYQLSLPVCIKCGIPVGTGTNFSPFCHFRRFVIRRFVIRRFVRVS